MHCEVSEVTEDLSFWALSGCGDEEKLRPSFCGVPRLAGPGLDSAPGIEQWMLCSSSAGSGRGRGHGWLPAGLKREALAGWPHRGAQMLICLFSVCFLAHRLVHLSLGVGLPP